jgi:putative oxidoreductase
MSDTSTVQTNSTSVQSSASAKPAAASASSAPLSRGELLKKVLIQQTFGLLCMRFVLGTTMIAYGVPIIMGGTKSLITVGSAMQHMGVAFGYEFWGLMACLVEVVGGVMLIIGAYYRISCLLLAFVMAVAAISKYAALGHDATSDQFISSVVHPLSMLGVFLSALFLGPGRLSVQKE